MRMIRLGIIGFVSLSITVTGLWANSDSKLEPQAILEARYAEMKVAMANRDPKAIAALLAPGFVSEDADGKATTADEMISEVVAMPKDPSKVSETRLLSVRVAGDLATVMQRYQMQKSRTPAAGAPAQQVELVTLSTDTWVKMGGVWLFQRTVTNTLDYTVDGKLLVHKEHGQ